MQKISIRSQSGDRKGLCSEEHKNLNERTTRAVFINGVSQVAQTLGKVRYPDAQSLAISGITVYANGLRRVFEVTAGQEYNQICRKRSGM